MNFITHRILNPAGTGQSFEDWVDGYFQKLASEKEASEKIAECGKEMGECSDAGAVTEKHTDAAPGDDKNKGCKVLINNDPLYQKGESTDPGKAKGKGKKGPDDKVVATATQKPKQAKVEQKEEEAKPKKPINTEGEKAMTNDPKLPKEDEGKKASAKSEFKKVANMNRIEKLGLFAALSSNPKNPISYIEAMVGLKFANMTDEEKTWFKKFWTVLYPAEYVSEMCKDR